MTAGATAAGPARRRGGATARTWSRSLAASVATTALDAGLFALATLFLAGPPLVAARWCSGALGAVANFAVNRRWAFRARGTAFLPQAGRYAAAAVVAVTLATLVWWALYAATGWDPRLLQLASMALVWLGFTFPVLRRWVFVPPGRDGAAQRTVAVAREPSSETA